MRGLENVLRVKLGITYSYILICIILCNSLPPVHGGLRDVVGKVYEKVIDYSCATFNSECCRAPFVRSDEAVHSLRKTMKKHFFGQHIATEVVLTALHAHLNDDNPKKPLVLSFHGWAGSGKTYLAELLVKALFKKGVESRYVRMYSASYNFPDKTKVPEYKKTLQEEIKSTLQECERAVIVFDEVDVTPPELYDSLVGFLDHLPLHGDVNHKKAIYIFLSNVGSTSITMETLNAWKTGKRREDLRFEDFHEIISLESFNAHNTGMSKTRIIERVLIDFFVPFLPMERQHALECVKAEIKQQGARLDPETIVKKLIYWPTDLKLFSQTGCKRVESLIKFYKSEQRMKMEL